MAALPFDPQAVLIGLAVLAVIGLFVWHLIREFRTFTAPIVRIADRRAEVQRLGIETANGQGKAESLWLRVVQVLCILSLIAAVTFALFNKFGLL